MKPRILIAILLGVLATLCGIAQTVDSGPKTYSSTVTVFGTPSISTANSVAVVGGGNVTYNGGTGGSVRLEPGFSVTGGGVFRAQIVPVPTITNPNTGLTGTTGTAFSYQVLASNGPITGYRLFGGLPTGLSFSTGSGIISGTPSAAGSWSWFVYASNAYGEGPPGQFSMTISSGTSSVPITTLTAIGASTVSGASNPSSAPVLYVASGQSFTITSLTTDSGNDLVTQQFDLSSDFGSTWSLANSGNNRLWSGSATGSNSLSKTFTVGDVMYLVRARGQDAQGAYSAYQYVSVYVGTPPSITTQPQSQSVPAGSTASFMVACSGSATISFQWQKNGTSISGATGTTFSLSNVQSSDAATYTCVVANYMGSTTSSGAVLTLGSSSGAPTITSSTTATDMVGTPFSYHILATNTPTSYGATGLPSWLTLNTTSGVLSGTPSAAGTTTITITATNAAGSGSATLFIAVGNDTSNANQLNIHIPY
jgi:hypothetical protein